MRRDAQSNGQSLSGKHLLKERKGTGLKYILRLVLFATLGLSLAGTPTRAQTTSPVTVTEVLNGSDEAVLQVNEDGGFVVLGEVGTGVIPTEGAGARLMWHPARAAFRAGEVGAFSGNESLWNADNVGSHSVAFGLDTKASATAATAMGNGTTASGARATAMGNSTTASGGMATAMGFSTTASGDWSTAMGRSTTASGDWSTAMGRSTTASGIVSTAMGRGTVAQAYASLVIGRFNVVAGSHDSWNADDPLFVAGNGTGSGSSRSNALTLLKNGDLTIAGTLTESSDRRLKTQVQPLEPALGKLLDMRPIRFHFRKETGHPTGSQIGLIAQEVQKAFPELVTKGSDGYLSLAYPKLTAVLLKGLQEQQTQIERQQAEIADLRAEHEATRERLAALEATVAGGSSTAVAGWTGLGAAGGLLLALTLGGLLGARLRRRR